MSTLKEMKICGSGKIITIDISEQACAKFGFTPGQRVIDPYKRTGAVAGVATLPENLNYPQKGQEVLWVILDVNPNRICFFPNPATDLKSE